MGFDLLLGQEVMYLKILINVITKSPLRTLALFS